MFKKTFLLTFVDGAGKSLGVLLTPIFLKLMTKEDFGENNYIIAVVSSLPVFLTLGIHATQIKEFISEKDIKEKQKIFSTSLITSILVSCFLLLFITLIGFDDFLLFNFFKITQNLGFKWALFCSYTITSCTGLILYSFAISTSDNKTIIIYSILKMILVNSFSLFFVIIKFNEDTSLSKLLGIALGDLIFNLCFFYFFCRSFWVFNFSYTYFYKAFRLGAPLIPAALATIISTSSDRYFIVKNYNKAIIAEYSLALMFLAPISILIVSAQTSLTPIIYSMKDNFEAYSYSLKFFFKYLIIVIIFLFLIQLVIIIAKYLNLIPTEYIYLNYFSFLLFFQTTIFASLQIPFNIFIKNNKTSLVALVSICISFFCVLSGLIITPIFGFSGLIITNAFFALIFLIFSFSEAKKITKINIT
jgi:O-antigen/teichoic acid export membrane protein